MHLSVLAEVLPLFERAFVVPLRLPAISIVLATVLGLVMALFREYRVPVLSQISAAVEELFRNTPLLIQLFFMYYGFPSIGIKMNAEACAIIGMAILGGAYMSGAFQGGFGGIPTVQIESARALGLSKIDARGTDPDTVLDIWSARTKAAVDRW